MRDSAVAVRHLEKEFASQKARDEAGERARLEYLEEQLTVKDKELRSLRKERSELLVREIPSHSAEASWAYSVLLLRVVCVCVVRPPCDSLSGAVSAAPSRPTPPRCHRLHTHHSVYRVHQDSNPRATGRAISGNLLRCRWICCSLTTRSRDVRV